MSYIFLSYAKADRDAALAMRDVLRREGLVAWMDENLLELNEAHWPVIEANILNAVAFIVLVSDAAKKSKWISRELDYAEKIGKPIFSILIEGEGWSRLKNEPIRAGLGLSLDLPDEFTGFVKKLDAPYANLPEQIPTITAEASGKPPYKLAITIAILLSIAIVLLRMFWPAPSVNVDTVVVTSTAVAVQNTLQVLNQERTQAAAGQTRLANVRGTQSAEMLTRDARNIAGTATSAERNEARATEFAGTAFYFQTAEYTFNQTAVVANRFVPCDVFAPRRNGELNLRIYRFPSPSSAYSITNPSGTESYHLIVREWIANSSGLWLKVGTEYFDFLGYVRAEAVELDGACTE